jgi:hypothetical protein
MSKDESFAKECVRNFVIGLIIGVIIVGIMFLLNWETVGPVIMGGQIPID